MKRTTSGFTVLELVFAIVLAGAACTIFFTQYHNLSVSNQDNQRKTAVNAMYYSLEHVYYKQHGYYPVSIDSSTLPSVDPSLFTDPDGNKIGTASSEYSYKATNCTDNKCASYTLKAHLTGEADYTKTSDHS